MSERQIVRVVVFYRDTDGMQRYVEYPPTCVVLTAEEAESVRAWLPGNAPREYANLLTPEEEK